ncbi:hypothetical protein BDY21DRAFT_348090 [Lineolata rhizophorae]|uniref:Uncharacterized protein n=1 Tax=Lineolata rhizophorae TaxID=578093 RepID=A0A6A6NWQ7_9PEZI|nr:hypothetical protein BDY21DRAFT_348090 [Lineolata rhizophorae]
MYFPRAKLSVFASLASAFISFSPPYGERRERGGRGVKKGCSGNHSGGHFDPRTRQAQRMLAPKAAQVAAAARHGGVLFLFADLLFTAQISPDFFLVFRSRI